jgi:phage/plasmid-associated DNA primase
VERRGWDNQRVLRELKPWLDHMFHIISDGYTSHFNYIMGWMSWVLVNKTKAGTGLLLMSDHGAGKSCVAEAYAEILGTTHACTLTKADELTGTFNSHLGFKNLIISEEATYGGSKKDQGNLKNIVTAKTMNIRPMYHPLMVMESRHNLIIISNLNRHVIPIEPTERRYDIIHFKKKWVPCSCEVD